MDFPNFDSSDEFVKNKKEDRSDTQLTNRIDELGLKLAVADIADGVSEALNDKVQEVEEAQPTEAKKPDSSDKPRSPVKILAVKGSAHSRPELLDEMVQFPSPGYEVMRMKGKVRCHNCHGENLERLIGSHHYDNREVDFPGRYSDRHGLNSGGRYNDSRSHGDSFNRLGNNRTDNFRQETENGGYRKENTREASFSCSGLRDPGFRYPGQRPPGRDPREEQRNERQRSDPRDYRDNDNEKRNYSVRSEEDSNYGGRYNNGNRYENHGYQRPNQERPDQRNQRDERTYQRQGDRYDGYEQKRQGYKNDYERNEPRYQRPGQGTSRDYDNDDRHSVRSFNNQQRGDSSWQTESYHQRKPIDNVLFKIAARKMYAILSDITLDIRTKLREVAKIVEDPEVQESIEFARFDNAGIDAKIEKIIATETDQQYTLEILHALNGLAKEIEATRTIIIAANYILLETGAYNHLKNKKESRKD